MKKLFVLTIALFAGVFLPVLAETTSYRIIQDGSVMMIIPAPSNNYIEQTPIQRDIFKVKSEPTKIPYYSSEKTLPKAKNRTRSV
jgi:hypothetical protein